MERVMSAANGSVLANMEMEEIAARVWSRRDRSPGIRFASSEQRRQKDINRSAILRLLSRTNWPNGLSILTMPGLYWRFERSLIAMREGIRGKDQTRWLRRTFIESIEEDEAIYRGSMKWIPGGLEISIMPTDEIASTTIRTQHIVRYHRCALEDYAARENPARRDVAWLDFNGQLTERRVAAIHRIMEGTKKYVFVTYMVGRTKAADAQNLRDGPMRLVAEQTYADSCLMSQCLFEANP
jgi:hypothetical protein